MLIQQIYTNRDEKGNSLGSSWARETCMTQELFFKIVCPVTFSGSTASEQLLCIEDIDKHHRRRRHQSK